jgi:zinc/manganese transport system substrate-binding protein
MTSSALPVALLAALVAAGCGTAASGDDAVTSPDASGSAVTAIGTTTVLGDVLGQITACAGGTSSTLMPAGADPHDFTPSSQQVASLVSADLVVANGLGLEEGLEDALAAAEADGATVLEVAPEVDPLPFGERGDDHAEDKGEDHADEKGDEHAGEEADDHGSLDPHVWQDVARMATAAELIGATLTRVSGDDAYAQCGTQVRDDLLEVDAQVRETLESVPTDRRVLVTDHDALGYLADAYGYEVVGTVIPGGSTLAEPSSAELAELASLIEQRSVPAIFANTANPTALVDAVAGETGTDIAVVELYVDSLGPQGSAADTYAGMVTTNAERIADALGS